MKRSHVSRRPPRWLVLACWLAAAALVSGCASSGRAFDTWLGGRGVDPWKIPPEAYPTQRLYRVSYEGPEGKANFKLTLYLEGEEDFRMRGADGLGRKVWELDVDPRSDRALWLDHRNEEYCQSASASRLAIVPLAHLPLIALPKLLLGQIPSKPASGLERSAEGITFLDARGERWNGGLAEGELLWWSKLAGSAPGQDGEPVSWWRREDGFGIFVDLRGGQQLRFREVVREPLARSPEPLEIPPAYRAGDCG